MWKSKRLQKGLGIAFLVSVIAVSLVFAAEESRPVPPGPDGQGGPGGFDRTAMQERMMERMKEQMGATDEEWAVIKPRLSEVMELAQETRAGGMMRGPGRGRRGTDQEVEEEEETSAVEKAASALQQILENDEASTAEIKAKLTALRSAREKAKQKLAEAQEKLREVLTLKQEAQLVMVGMLD